MRAVGEFDPSDFASHPERFYRMRYVWQWPIRICHWLTVATLSALFLSGLYMAHPILAPAGEPARNFLMGRIREVHFAAGFVFLISFLWRIYWFWMGNNYARSGFPFLWRAGWWRDLWQQARDYLSLHRGHVHLGHNALGGLTYTVFVILLGWGQILTGLALYSESNPGGLWDHLAGWVVPLFGGAFQTRMWHHVFGWGFPVFAVIHVYVVLFDSYQYGNGLVASMVSGFKFTQKGDLDHDTWVS